MILLIISWQLLNYVGAGTWSAHECETTFQFPLVTQGAFTGYPAFLVSTDSITGNLSNRTLTCTFTLDTVPGTAFRFGGYYDWNWCDFPPNARLFFSSQTGYSHAQYSTRPKDFWFCTTAWVIINDQTGTVTLSAPMRPEYWSDAGGCSENCGGDFWSSVANVAQVGLAFGGGCFYDVGLAQWLGGTNEFRLLNYGLMVLPKSVKEIWNYNPKEVAW